MPSPRDAAPTADRDDANAALQDLQAELGEVEWFGRRALARRPERLAAHPRWRIPAIEAFIWSRQLASRE